MSIVHIAKQCELELSRTIDATNYAILQANLVYCRLLSVCGYTRIENGRPL